MCAQLNSPLGPSRNNKQSVTSDTRLHYQLNYQLELLKNWSLGWVWLQPSKFLLLCPRALLWMSPFLRCCMSIWITGHKKTVSAFHSEPSLFLWKKQLEGPGISIMGTQMEPPLSSEVPVTSGLYLSGTIPRNGQVENKLKKKKN